MTSLVIFSILAAIFLVVGLVFTIWMSVKEIVNREYSSLIFNVVLTVATIGALFLVICVIVSNLT